MFRGTAGFEFNSVELPIARLAPELVGLRILHLSDLHVRSYWTRAYDELIAGLAKDPPDLILFTGDFIDDKHDPRPALPHLRKLLPALQSRLGTYAILGNHDPVVAASDLAKMGVNLIDGARAVLETDSASLELIGLPGVARHDLDAAYVASLPAKTPGVLRIVLSHYPDHVRRIRPLKADLMLTGHTHGGQICLPGGRPLITHDKLPRPYHHGVHQLEKTWVIVSRGFGFASPPVRLFCPAEVVQITLVGEAR